MKPAAAVERTYQRLLKDVRLFEHTAGNGKDRRQFIRLREPWDQVFKLYEQARFARLCSYVRGREPDAEVNYSILTGSRPTTSAARSKDRSTPGNGLPLAAIMRNPLGVHFSLCHSVAGSRLKSTNA
jgi:hypothetical protein